MQFLHLLLYVVYWGFPWALQFSLIDQKNAESVNLTIIDQRYECQSKLFILFVLYFICDSAMYPASQPPQNVLYR